MPHKLLLADDSVTIQRVIELTFADEDVQVLAVGDGKQAIARVLSDRPDIVLADVGMPERDGGRMRRRAGQAVRTADGDQSREGPARRTPTTGAVDREPCDPDPAPP